MKANDKDEKQLDTVLWIIKWYKMELACNATRSIGPLFRAQILGSSRISEKASLLTKC